MYPCVARAQKASHSLELWGEHLPERETSGSWFAWVDNLRHRYLIGVNILRQVPLLKVLAQLSLFSLGNLFSRDALWSPDKVHRHAYNKVGTKTPTPHIWNVWTHEQALIHFPQSAVVVCALTIAFASLPCIPSRASPWLGPEFWGFQDSQSYLYKNHLLVHIQNICIVRGMVLKQGGVLFGTITTKVLCPMSIAGVFSSQALPGCLIPSHHLCVFLMYVAR